MITRVMSQSAVPECKKVIGARKPTNSSDLPPSKKKVKKKKLNNHKADEKENNSSPATTKSSMYVPKFCLPSSSPPGNTTK